LQPKAAPASPEKTEQTSPPSPQAELDELCKTACHDLRAPLRAMRAWTNAVLEDWSGKTLGAEGQRQLGLVLRAGEKLDSLILALRSYASSIVSELKTEAVDLDVIAATVLRALGPQADRSGATLQVDGPLGVVRGDSAALTVVLSNLVSNALKFTRPEVPARVRIGAEVSGPSRKVRVDDEGIGIDPAYLPKLFRPFERLHGDDQYPGNGLGLAVAARLLERQGGSIGVDPRPEGGSSFWFELPGA
jgi:signal transduction histidine kinase